jgi:hypothetical protein
LSLEFSDHLKQCGIVPQLTLPRTPQWNGVSERRNRSLLDMVRLMMSQTDPPLSFWGYALKTVVFTLNRVPTKSVERTPYEIWTGKCPELSFLKVWGCEAYVKCLMSDKLTPKSDKYLFVGYLRETKGYYFYNKAEGKVFIAHNGVFMEKEFLSNGVSGSKVQLEEIQEIPKNVSAPIDPIQEVQDVVPPDVEAPSPHRSMRARRATEKFTLLTMEQCDILLLDNDEPMTYTKAMMGPTLRNGLESWNPKLNPCTTIKFGTCLIQSWCETYQLK